MIVMVGIGPRLAVLSDRDFAGRWAGRHAAVVRELPGLRRYVQHHALPGRPHPAFDCFAELHFEDLEAMKAAFRSEHYRDVVAVDEADLVDRDRMIGFRSEMVRDFAGDPPAAVVRVHRGELPPKAPPRCRRLVALPGDRTGITGIDVIAFDSPEAALAAARTGDFPSRPWRQV